MRVVVVLAVALVAVVTPVGVSARAKPAPPAAACAALWNKYASLPLKTAALRAHPIRIVASGRLVIGGTGCSVLLMRSDGRWLVTSTPCTPGKITWSPLKPSVYGSAFAANSPNIGSLRPDGRIALS